VNYGAVLFRVDSGASSQIIGTSIGASGLNWANGSKHTMAGCIMPTGEMRLFVDGGATPVATGTLGAAPPDLATGRVRVGSDGNTAFHGYVSRAVVCRPAPTGGVPAGCQ
jgi:hypothetical protein